MTKINSGTYGCIYKSETITCVNDRSAPKDKYIAKVVDMKYSKMEFDIGREIREKIPCYEYFFAPMEYKCEIETKTLDQNLINECQAVKNVKSNEDIGIGKIRNIHGFKDSSKIYTLKEIVSKWLNKLNDTEFKTQYLDTFQYLLKSIQRLQKIEIIHNDIKENNILYDEYNECPIIIDFGMSMQMKTVEEPEPLKNRKLIFIGSNFFTIPFENVVMGKLKRGMRQPTKTASTISLFSTQESQTIDRQTLKKWLYEFIDEKDEYQNVFKHGAFNEEQQGIFVRNYEKKIEEWIPEDKEVDIEPLFKTLFEETKIKTDIYSLGIVHLYLCIEFPELQEIDWTTSTPPPTKTENTMEPVSTNQLLKTEEEKTNPFFDLPIFEGAFKKVFSEFYFETAQAPVAQSTEPE